MCWGLAHAYWALFNTIQNPQGEEKVSGSNDKTTGTVATPALVTGTTTTPTLVTCAAATPSPVTGTAVTPTPATGTVAEPGNQPMPVSVAPIHKKKSWKRKSACLERDDEKAGPSRGEEEEEEELINKTETTRSLSPNELRDMRKNFSHHPGKWTTTERGNQYLRELAVLEVIYGDLDNEQLSKDPDEVSEEEILAAYEGVQPALEVVGTEAQLLLAPRLPVLGWMFKGRVLSTHHATDATWSKWVALITQRARIGNPNCPGILEVIMDWPEGKDFRILPEEEVMHTEEGPLYNKLSENEKQYAPFTDGSCRIVGKHRRWKAAVWSPIQQVVETAEGEGESSQFAEVKAIQLALDIADQEKWPVLCLYTDSWMVANALWGWLQQWKQSNRLRRGKPIWAAVLWQDIAAQVENLVVEVCHIDAHVPKSLATEEHQKHQQVDQAAKIEVAKVDLDWQHKGELFRAGWAPDTSGHQGRDATYRWACGQGMDLTMDTIAQVIHECETCAAIKQAKQLKPLWYGGRWLKYKYGEAWQMGYITLPQTHQGKRHVLTMVKATTGWLETYPVPQATAQNTILGLEKQVLWRHGTPEKTESDNRTHFQNNLIDTWAKEHGMEWVHHIAHHAPASGKIKQYNGLLKTTLQAMGGGTFKHWDTHLAKATWLVNTRGSAN
ncbi:hypothetical protein QYF61_003741 [Mycteria americana]|uniref:Uncharacterized protein n=1 Tax=Mycteria americana TaxID=33587 RepID=A0AAN7RU61_MYCAM|nr:hypothetical protein QYF61_003741 [Mycteria americana]